MLFVKHPLAHLALMGQQHFAYEGEGLAAHAVGEVLGHLVYGLDETLGVAHLAQWAGRIAKREILVSVAPFPNCWPQQPKKGADLFEALAGFVNCHITRAIGRLGHLR
jgi:hypothetical protein